MSSRFHQDDLSADRSPKGGVYVELFGGSQDGELLRTKKRWDFITHAQEISIEGSGGAENEQVRTIETLYEYCGCYRLCKGYGRIYKYECSEVKLYEPEEIDELCDECNDQAGLSEFEGIRPEDLLGTRGADQCPDDPNEC